MGEQQREEDKQKSVCALMCKRFHKQGENIQVAMNW